MRNKNNKDIIEKGSNCYWYFWHLANEGAEGIIDNALLFALRCLSPIYYAGFLLHQFGRKKNIPKKYPVISVGNITLGGTGKSPCVEFLTKKLLSRKRRVGLLTTGYGRKDKDDRKLVFSEMRNSVDVEEVGDESYLFSKHFSEVPVFISRNRAKNFLRATKEKECNVFIMDDGFQYPCIDKDLEILLINKRNPFGNGSLFPGGILREPIGSINRADLIILTHADEYSPENKDIKLPNMLSQKATKIPVLESIHQPLYFENNLSGEKYKFEELTDKKLLSLSSLADPLSFEESLTKLGLKVVRKVRFPDHYIYKQEDVEWLSEITRKETIDFIVTTEKDRVRLPKGLETLIPTLCLVMDFKIIKGEEILDNMINRMLEEYKV